MHNYAEMNIKELLKLTKITIHNLHSNMFQERYSFVVNEELKMKIIYLAILRINMFLATNVIKTTIYSFDIENLAETKQREKLIQIIEACENTTYEKIRDAWYENGLKDLFYKQKEDKKIAEKIAAKCIIIRNETKKGFVTFVGNTLTIDSNINMASEFPIFTLDDTDINLIKNIISAKFPNDSFKVFFNSRMADRQQANSQNI